MVKGRTGNNTVTFHSKHRNVITWPAITILHNLPAWARASNAQLLTPTPPSKNSL